VRLAIFGGTFDPVHNAHIAVAREAVRRCSLDQVLFIPAARPPHKWGTQTSYEHRYCMVELACAADPAFQPSRLEEGNESSYSIRTIEQVSAGLASQDALFFLMGADAFAEIETWHRWRDVVRAVEFIIASRPGHSFTTPACARVYRIDDVEWPISSSEIRRALASGKSDVEVPPAVLDYIRSHNLYSR
jgi:nicotinate-nucleotide adenylyltransferase